MANSLGKNSFLDMFKGRSQALTKQGPMELFDAMIEAQKKRIRDMRCAPISYSVEAVANITKNDLHKPHKKPMTKERSEAHRSTDKSNMSKDFKLPRITQVEKSASSNEMVGKVAIAIELADRQHSKKNVVDVTKEATAPEGRLLRNDSLPRLREHLSAFRYVPSGVGSRKGKGGTRASESIELEDPRI